MPGCNWSPTVALVAGVDLRPWAGQTVLRRGAREFVIPAWALPGEGVFQDFLDALNGRGESRSLQQLAQTALNVHFPGEWMDISINEADRVYIECSLPFQLNATDSPVPYGWPAHPGVYDTELTDIGSWRVTAPEDWKRGPFQQPNRWNIDIDPEGAKVNLSFGGRGAHQDVITSLRSSGANPTEDEDRVYSESLQRIDNLTSIQSSIIWALNAEGKLEISTSTAIEELEWASDSFRDLLGFTGLETPETFGFYRMLRSTYTPAPVLIIDRLARAPRSVIRDTSTVRLSNGLYGVVNRGIHARRGVEFYLRGPATQRDQVEDYLERFSAAAPDGFALNFYQEWGEFRRAIRSREVNATQPAYSLTRTAERDGKRGRILGQRTPGDAEISPQWTHDIEMEALIKLSIDELRG